jgi:hypothetical protein
LAEDRVLKIKTLASACLACDRSPLRSGRSKARPIALQLGLTNSKLRSRFSPLVIVQERQEGIASPLRHRLRLVQQRAGEHDRAASRRPVGARSELGEAQVAALIIFRIQVDRTGEFAMRSALGGVVPVRPEVPAIFSVITGDDEALDALASN